MADVQVTCVDKSDATHEGIRYVGGAGWRWPIADVIASIEGKTNTFFVLAGGKRAEIAVVEGKHKKYLRTHADGYWNDNLLALPSCSP